MKSTTLFLAIILFTLSACSSSKDLTQKQDAENLSSLLLQITTLSESENCTDPSNWDFIAYGSKACGGPQGYIAYAKNIDTSQFIKLVEEYTQAEDAYNNKWNIVSDCAFLMPPTSINCENGKAVLIY